MKIHGYCERCHKIKLVHATNAAMMRYARTGTIIGLCSSCEEEQRRGSQSRHPAYRNRP